MPVITKLAIELDDTDYRDPQPVVMVLASLDYKIVTRTVWPIPII